MDTHDIPGAVPKQLVRTLRNAPTLMTTHDIERCRPRKRFEPLKNVPNRLLVTEDIKGTKPDTFQFKSNRDSNPLNPHYKLQTVTYVE